MVFQMRMPRAAWWCPEHRTPPHWRIVAGLTCDDASEAAPHSPVLGAMALLYRRSGPEVPSHKEPKARVIDEALRMGRSLVLLDQRLRTAEPFPGIWTLFTLPLARTLAVTEDQS